MATLLTPLVTPEAGWRRIEESNANFSYVGTWSLASGATYSGNSLRQSSASLGNFARIRFSGDKIRIMATTSSGYSTLGKVKIDSTEYTVNFRTASSTHMNLVFELTGLSAGKHSFELTTADALNVTLDAIDIADTADVEPWYPSYLTEKTSIDDIATIGDYIRCDYASPVSGANGVFSNLGSPAKAPIASTSSATPDGSLALVYVGDDHLGRKLLLSDRIVQNTISWKSLQLDSIATPSGIKANKYFNYDPLIPVMTATTQDGITVATDGTTIAGGTLLNIFDQNATTYLFQGTALPSGSTKHFIIIDFGTTKLVNAIMKSSNYAVSSGYNGIKNWTLYGSNDNTTWTKLVDGVHQNTGAKELDEFENSTSYRYYKFETDSWSPTSSASISISDFQLYSKKVVDKFLNYNLYLRIPKKYEYEKYILKNNFGGQGATGDMSLWNYSASLYTILVDGYGAYRWMYSTTITNNAASSTAVSYGFRPMFVLEQVNNISSLTKTLIQDGLDDTDSPLKKYNLDTNQWETIIGLSFSTSNPTDFETHGMSPNDWSLIPNNAWDLLSNNAQIRSYSPAGLPKNAKFTFVPEDKLILMTTDYTINNAMNFDNFNVTATTSGLAVVKFIISPDSGLTWHAWDGTQWNIVNPTKADVSANGMTIAQFNSMGNNIFDILTTANTIRFGSFTSMNDSTEIAEIDTYSYQYDGFGTEQPCILGTDYNVVYDYTHSLVKVHIYISGDLKVSYVQPLDGNGGSSSELTWGTF